MWVNTIGFPVRRLPVCCSQIFAVQKGFHTWPSCSLHDPSSRLEARAHPHMSTLFLINRAWHPPNASAITESRPRTPTFVKNRSSTGLRPQKAIVLQSNNKSRSNVDSRGAFSELSPRLLRFDRVRTGGREEEGWCEHRYKGVKSPVPWDRAPTS